jgi:hypothetical protein
VVNRASRPGRVPECAFTPSESASLALLRRAIEAGAYDDDLTPPGTALDGQIGGAVHATGRLGGSGGHSQQRKQHVNGDIVIACLNGAGIIAAIVAAALRSGAM